MAQARNDKGGKSKMSTRKFLRARVRRMAELSGARPSKAVHYWRKLLDVYPSFHGSKCQKKRSKQPVLSYARIVKGVDRVYPVPAKERAKNGNKRQRKPSFL